MQVTTPRNGHDRQLPAMSAARFKRDGRGSMLRPLTRRTTKTNRQRCTTAPRGINPVGTLIASLIAVGSEQFEPLLHYLCRGL